MNKFSAPVYLTSDGTGCVLQIEGPDERFFFEAYLGDSPLMTSKKAPFPFASLKAAKEALEELKSTGKWARPKRRYKAYPTYNPKVEGYGNEAQWRATFELLFAQNPNEAVQVLGVSLETPWSEVKAAYRKLQLENHPDRGGDPQKFIQIQEAFEALRLQKEA